MKSVTELNEIGGILFLVLPTRWITSCPGHCNGIKSEADRINASQEAFSFFLNSVGLQTVLPPRVTPKLTFFILGRKKSILLSHSPCTDWKAYLPPLNRPEFKCKVDAYKNKWSLFPLCICPLDNSEKARSNNIGNQCSCSECGNIACLPLSFVALSSLFMTPK